MVLHHYSAQSVVKTLNANARSDELKMHMRVRPFTTTSDAITKFIELSSETSEALQINYINRHRNNYSRGNNLYEEVTVFKKTITDEEITFVIRTSITEMIIITI